MHIVAPASTWQDGRFDLADRLFHSVSEEWGLASGERGSDTGCVKARKPSIHPSKPHPVAACCHEATWLVPEKMLNI